MKLSDFTVGDRVTLSGAGCANQSLFIGDIDREGYYLLWKNKADRLANEPWVCAAAGSHSISEGKSDDAKVK